MRGRLNDEERVALMLDSIDAIQQYTQEIISFEDLLWIPAVFLHYEAFNLEWTLLITNLMALVVFLSVGKRMGTREWASRALRRLAALFQACVVGLIYLLVLKGVVWCVYTLWLGRPEFYLEREHPQLLLFFTMVMYLIIGLVLCWRLWVQSFDEGRK